MATILTHDACEAIRRSMSSRGRASNSTRSYVADVNQLFLEMGVSQVHLKDLEVIAGIWLTRSRQSKSPATVRRRLAAVRELGRAYGLQILQDYSVPTLAEPIPTPLPRLNDDLFLMLDHAEKPGQRALIAFQGLCGLRVGESIAINTSHVDVASMVMTVHGKGDKYRVVPLSDTAWSYVAPAYVGCMTDARKPLVGYADRSAREFITTHAARTGVGSQVSSHDLRATFATETYNRTKDLNVVRKLMGHASTQQTLTYVGTSMASMRAAVSFYREDNNG